MSKKDVKRSTFDEITRRVVRVTEQNGSKWSQDKAEKFVREHVERNNNQRREK